MKREAGDILDYKCNNLIIPKREGYRATCRITNLICIATGRGDDSYDPVKGLYCPGYDLPKNLVREARKFRAEQKLSRELSKLIDERSIDRLSCL